VGLGFLVAISAYGFSVEGLFAQPVWDWTGLERLLLFAAVFAGFFLAIVAWRPGWVAPLSFLAALVYTAATAGPLALLAVLFFLFSCFALGRLLLGRHAETALDDLLAVLAGASIYVWLVGLAVHFPVNYPTIYLAGLAVPILSRPRNTAACLRRCASLFRPAGLASQEGVKESALRPLAHARGSVTHSRHWAPGRAATVRERTGRFFHGCPPLATLADIRTSPGAATTRPFRL
jgi:hypothetical protein